MSKQLVMLGMHRSGTSLLFGVCKELGIFIGNRLLGKSRSNPLGHFEDKEFVDLNEAILRSLKSSWDRPPKGNYSINENFKSKMEKLIKSRDSSYEIWGWKDPRTCLFINTYKQYLTNPYYIICNRNPKDIAKSLLKRNGFSMERSLKLTSTYTESIKNFVSSIEESRCLFIDYNKFIENPDTTIQSIIYFLVINPNQEQITNSKNLVCSREKIKKLSDNFKKS